MKMDNGLRRMWMLFLSIYFTIGCGESKEGKMDGPPGMEETDGTDTQDATDHPVFERPAITHCDESVPAAPVDIRDAQIAGDFLNIEISYESCGDNRLGLCTTGFIVDETPGRTDAWVAHYKPEAEDCEVMSTNLEFDLRPLWSILGLEPGLIEIRLEGWGVIRYEAAS